MNTERMIAAHPGMRGGTADSLIRCIESCYSCAQICLSCADACLAEEHVTKLRQCIRLDLDCAVICQTAGAIASRGTGSNDEIRRQILDCCANACDICAQECERHASAHEHCRICAEECRHCETACREALTSLH
jgi:hypothetical protein